MTYSATLVCNPRAPSLDDAAVSRARALLPNPGEIRWLAKGVAADIAFAPDAAIDNREAAALAARIAAELGDARADVIVQPIAHRRKRLLIADMDSTMIGQECIDELADFAGLKEKVSGITERAMRGEIAFEPALRERVGLLAGLPSSVIADVIATRITLNPGARTLVMTMRAHGAYAALVSGGFTAFTSRIADAAGFHENRANILTIDNEKLSGKVEEPILGQEAKLSALRELRARLELTQAETLAVGDGANDLAMLGEAGLGVAFRAKPAVAAAAHARIEHSDLTALLYAQGYPRSAFVD